MKLRRALSGILFGVGCAMAFVGLLALILPAVANDQMQLVLASFSLSSPHPVVSLINRCMSFALAHGWQVLLAGSVILTIGVTLFTHFLPDEPQQPHTVYRQPQPTAAQPLWEMPEPVQNGPNPFAQTSLWEQFAPRIQPFPARDTPVLGFGSPLLEPNRLEEETVASSVPPAYERPAATPPLIDSTIPSVLESSVSPAPFSEEIIGEQQDEIPVIAEGTLPLPEESTPEETTAAGVAEGGETVPESGKPVQISPRIRSTVGKRREW